MRLSPRTRMLLLHDATVFIAAFLTTGILDNGQITWSALSAAAITAVKVTLRQILPVPPKPAAPVASPAGPR